MSKIHLKILNSLGYLTIPVLTYFLFVYLNMFFLSRFKITHEEFSKASSIFNQVKLVKDKINIYSKHPTFVETYF
jgi:hypothetical protein